MSGNKLNIESEETIVSETAQQPSLAAKEETVKQSSTIPSEEPQTTAIPQPKKGSWAEVVDRISYQGIVRNMPYLIFLTVLCILYITNSNRAISLTRSINDKEKELKELRWKYLDLQSRLMFQTSETQMINKTSTLGLKPLEKPAFEIKVKVPVAKED